MSNDISHSLMGQTQTIIKHCLSINRRVGDQDLLREKKILFEKLDRDTFDEFMSVNDVKDSNFAFAMDHRYRKVTVEDLISEQKFLLELVNYIDAPKHRKIKNIRNLALDMLSTKIGQVISKFPNDHTVLEE